MPILRFLRRASQRELATMGVLTAVAGAASAVLLAIVNDVAEQVVRGQSPGAGSWAAFVAGFALYLGCNRAALLEANRVIETLLRDLRLEVAEKVRRSELLVVDATDRTGLYTLVSQETNNLSAAFPVLVDCVQQATLLVCALVYLATLSFSALLLFLATTLVGVLAFLRINGQLVEILTRTYHLQAQMLDDIRGIIDGFKEVRLNQARSDSVFASFEESSARAEELLTEFGTQWVSVLLLTNFVGYYMLATVAFVFPKYIAGHTTIVFALTPTLLFCLGPLIKVVGVGPMVARANVGIHQILTVLEVLEAAGGVDPDQARARAEEYRDFQTIEAAGLRFRYRDADGNSTFAAGPLDLTLRRGEVVFLVGGNGSGKSTALRLLTGLYPADSGSIRVDGAPLHPGDLAGYRELFTAVFADFHLFDRLYGIGTVDPARVTGLIETMRLSHKVRFEDGRFTDLALSTGQRKRLALIVALLEDRPVYVFDEWPAEQDQEFREYFYQGILPMLKAQGATVLAVTHDDRYWHVADRVVRLDLGAITWQRTGDEVAAALGAGDLAGS